MKQARKMSQSGRFVTTQVKMVGQIVTATLRPPWVWVDLVCHSGRSEPKDIALGGRSVGVKTLLGRSKRERFVKAPLQAARGLHCTQISMGL